MTGLYVLGIAATCVGIGMNLLEEVRARRARQKCARSETVRHTGRDCGC